MFEDIKNMSFEEAMAELESIIKKMEAGDIKLDQSGAFYERGVALKEHCESILKSAKLKIEKIQLKPSMGNMDEGKQFETVPLEIK